MNKLKNEKWRVINMSKITFLDNIFKGKYNDFFIGLYKRNKMFLIVSATIYFLSLFIGLFMGYFLPGSIEHFLANVVKSDKEFVSKNGISTLSIFLHNLTFGVFATYAGGIIGIITAGILFINGFPYGSFLGYLASNYPYWRYQ